MGFLTFTIRFGLLGVVSLLAWSVGAQWSDNFEDGELSNNPSWQGDLSSFVVDQGQLRLMDPASGDRSLWTSYESSDTSWHQWTGSILLDFAPSNSNRVAVVIWADEANISYQNGLELSWGESGSDDRLIVTRTASGSKVVVAEGSLGSLADAPSSLRFQLEWSEGQYLLSTNYVDNPCLSLELQWEDVEPPASDVLHFGLWCRFTTSRNDLFFFDDLSYNRSNFPHGESPLWSAVMALDSQTLELSLTGALDSAFFLDTDLYSIQPDDLQVVSAVWTEDALQLQLNTSLNSGDTVLLTVDQFRDCNGALKGSQTRSVTYVQVAAPGFHDILFTEIMADPNPPVDLPEDIEWLEIFNRSNSFIEASTLRLFRNEVEISNLPEVVMPPGSYWIVCHEEDEEVLSQYGSLMPLSSFPTLSNGGDQYALVNPLGLVIDEVEWDRSWYQDPDKDDGGYSLAIRRLGSPCEGSSNWSASTHPQGGSPGRQNTSFDSTQILARVLSASVEDSMTIRIDFNLSMDTNSVGPEFFIFDPFLAISQIDFVEDRRAAVLKLESPLPRGERASVTVLMDLLDCAGNMLASDQSLEIVLPFAPRPQDILIHEILFDPEVGGSDYIELLNVSDRLLSTDGLILRNGMRDDEKPLPSGILLEPQQLWVWTEDSSYVVQRYLPPHPQRVRSMDLPGWNQDMGNAILIYEQEGQRLQIDSMEYSEDYHFQLLDETKGVALERVFADLTADQATNWASASAPLFGTPTGPNSQSGMLSGQEGFSIPEAVFSPDNDGFRDFLVIEYQFSQGGKVATASIYDQFGVEHNRIVENQLLGASGIIRWDGLDADGNQLPVGRYIVLIEYFDNSGRTGSFKEVCVLAASLD